ncbi:hypothetical protein [Streptomyces sp. bgisy100]|uniref:hypothetical protein n=1 Tax=Streptomyces sp. bgisy100 TaxID=3413783 RepID=UPI003D72B0E1
MALFKKKRAGKPGEWFYCLQHKKVEEGPECPAEDRLGPYPTRGDAERAMETAAERNREWENDPRWHDKASPDAEG